MTNPALQNITIYPIKSSTGINLSTSWVEELGLAFDRRFVVTSLNGEAITARTHPHLCLVQTNLTTHGLILTAPDMPALTIDYHKMSTQYKDVKVWNDTIKGQLCDDQINRWFSLYLKTPCTLLFFGEGSTRFVKNRNTQVGFADGYPLLLISQASLDHLNSRLPSSVSKISMAQFRPNIVVNHCDAFAEDTWQHIRIGEVEFEISKPCTRCIFTTIDPVTAEKHARMEPLNTLKKFRQLDNGELLFGQNLVALNQGQIKQGDPVEIIAKQSAPNFIVNKKTKVNVEPSTTKTNLLAKTKQPKITFTHFNKTFIGDNQHSLLEQGESAGLLMPYSCRAGMCGRCKAKLIEGEVLQGSTDGLSELEQQQGFILTCCSKPLTEVTVEHELPQRRRSVAIESNE